MQQLAGVERLLQRRIRETRGPRDALLSTSELYATVIAEFVVDTMKAGAVGPGAATAVGDRHRCGHTSDLRNLLQFTRDSVTRACRTVARWRDVEGSSTHHASRSYPPPSSPLDRSESRLAMQRLIDGLPHEDRELLYLRLKGRSWAAIAEASGMTEVGCRQRWVRMMTALRSRFPHD